MELKTIKIDTSNVPHSGGRRIITVSGDKGASFTVKLIGPQGNYNFSSKAYDAGESAQSVFKGVVSTRSVSIPINFPDHKTSTGWDTQEYRLYIYPDAHKGVKISSNVGDKNVFYRTITQLEDRVVTVQMKNSSASFTTVTSKTSTGNNASNIVKTLKLDQNITNTATDANGFGLRLIRQPLETDFMFLTSDTVDGAITSSNKVVVDDLTDIGVGMIIHTISSGTLTGTPTITAIDEDKKELTLSSAQTFSDGITLNFRAIGLDAIRNSTGISFTFQGLSVTADEISKTVRTTASGTTVNLNGTYGISGGGHVTISGVNIVNTSANTVQSVSASSSAGSMVMEVAQVIKAGSKIYFHGCTDTIRLKGNLIIDQYPTKDQTIYLVIDNFITAGAAS
tara:strand:- start:3041 stop:4225 length:1185 start_codon:yes stop_codon:yes gene_type:complete